MNSATDMQALESLTLDELRCAWSKRFHDPVPLFRTRELLLRAFVYKVETRAHGAASLALVRRLEELAQSCLADPDFQPVPKPSLSPGTRLSREWNGENHVVDVTDRGFVYRDKIYRSLTKVALAITGAHWSGPRFFGVRDDLSDAK